MSIELAKHVFKAGEGEQLHWGGPAAGSVTIMIDPGLSGSTDFCVLTQSLAPGSVVPTHHHTMAEQVLFVVSGSGQISLDDRQVEAQAGTTVHIPKGVPHEIVNTGNEALTLLEITSPPGFQEIFREMHGLGEPSADDIARIGPKYDIVVHPAADQ
jgi:mannose-6-phosphate isomerase-like protein (cupin superfamily)